jgi:hypothetical protein
MASRVASNVVGDRRVTAGAAIRRLAVTESLTGE